MRTTKEIQEEIQRLEKENEAPYTNHAKVSANYKRLWALRWVLGMEEEDEQS